MTEGLKANNRDFCRCNVICHQCQGVGGWCCTCSKPRWEWQDGLSDHTIDRDDWIEAWLKVQQDHLKRQRVWTRIRRLQDQTLYYHDPICTAQYFWTLHEPFFLAHFKKKKGPLCEREWKRGNNEMERWEDQLYFLVHNRVSRHF